MMTDYNYDALIGLFDTLLAKQANGTAAATNGEWEPPTPLVDWVEAYGVGEDPARWLAEPLLPDQGAVAIFAKGGTGKSLLALWLAAGLATGAGLVAPPQAVEVLYLDYEMTLNTVVERLEDMGYDDPEALKRLHYASLPSLAPLDTLEGGRAVVDMARHLGVALVVIDTFGRAVDGEEDRADTVRAWYRWTGQLLKGAGIAFLRIDHAGKDAARGQRGTSAKNDDVDIVWEMSERGHGEYLLRATKRRVSWVPERVVLARRSTDAGLAYHWADRVAVSYLAGAGEVADLLDELEAPVDISRRKAIAMLRDVGHGRNNNVVADGLRFRRERLGTTVQYHRGRPFQVVPVPDVDTAASPQVDHPRYHGVPLSEPDGPGEHTYVVRAPVQATSGPVRGLFDDVEDDLDA
jgi:hypothetical protein